MRKVFLILALAVGVSLQFAAMQDEKDGFRGIKWGDPVPGGFVFQENLTSLQSSFYLNPKEDLHFQSLPVASIHYGFRSSQFFHAVVFFPAAVSIEQVRVAAAAKWGPPDKDLKGQRDGQQSMFYQWIGNRTLVTLSRLDNGMVNLVLHCQSAYDRAAGGGDSQAPPEGNPTTLSASQSNGLTQGVQHPPLEIRINPKDGLEYVWIPPGTFKMGCVPGDSCNKFETPQHWMKLTKGFWLCRTEATLGAYAKYLAETGRKLSAGQRGPNFPVVWEGRYNADQDAAIAYCKWAGGRLPTEAEWEYACRAGHNDTVYPWGNDPPTCNDSLPTGVRFRDCPGGDETAEVGSFPPNDFKLFDMIGNAQELVQDTLSLYENWAKGGTDVVYYSDMAASGQRLRRGGGVGFDKSALRASARNNQGNFGVRCVCDDIPGPAVAGRTQSKSNWNNAQWVKEELAREAAQQAKDEAKELEEQARAKKEDDRRRPAILQSIEKEISHQVQFYNQFVSNRNPDSAVFAKIELIKLQQRYYANLPGNAPDRIPLYHDMQDRLEIPFECRQQM